MDKIKIADIIIDPDRIRKDFDEKKHQELVKSIKEIGLIEPLILEKKEDGFHLLAGERRVRALKELGVEETEYCLKENLDPWQRMAMELFENIHREDLRWDVKNEAELKLHELYQERFGTTRERVGNLSWVGKRSGGWRTQDTAELVGEAVGPVRENLQLAKAVRLNPELAKKETREAALRAMKVGFELGLMRDIAGILAEARLDSGEKPIQIIRGDSLIELPKFPDESFSFCITDPPYGIGIHDMQETFPNRGEVRQGIEFDDARKVLEGLVKPVMADVYRLLIPGSHCYIFFAIARYTEVRALMEEVGFWVCSTPLLWIKNNALNLRPHISYPVNYEPVFYCSKGYPPRPLTTIQVLSTFTHPILSGQTKRHPTQKPIKMIEWLIGNCSQPKERGIDPFLGGGTFTKACKNLDRLAVGVEVDEVWWLASKQYLEEEQSDKSN